jgi:hypothetical protein
MIITPRGLNIASPGEHTRLKVGEVRVPLFDETTRAGSPHFNKEINSIISQTIYTQNSDDPVLEKAHSVDQID